MNIVTLLESTAVSAAPSGSNKVDAGADSADKDFNNIMHSMLTDADEEPTKTSQANGTAEAQEKTAWLAALFRNQGGTTPDPTREASSQAPTEPLTIQKLIGLLQLLSQSQLGQTGELSEGDSKAQGLGQLASFLAALKNASEDDASKLSLNALLSLLAAAIQPTGSGNQLESGSIPAVIAGSESGLSSEEAINALQQIFGDKDLTADLSSNPHFAELIEKLTEVSQQAAPTVSTPAQAADIEPASASQAGAIVAQISTNQEENLPINPAAEANTSPVDEASAETTPSHSATEGGTAAKTTSSFSSLLAANKATGEIVTRQVNNPSGNTADQTDVNPNKHQAASTEKAAEVSSAIGQTMSQLSSQSSSSTTGATEASNVVSLPGIPALHQIVNTIRSVAWKGDSEVRLHLKPETLGQLHIQLSTNDGVVSIRMMAETGQAQALINEHLPQLKAALTAQGIQLDQLSVSTSSNPGNFSFAEKQADDRFGSQFQNSQGGSDSLEAQAAATALTDPYSTTSMYAVDYRV